MSFDWVAFDSSKFLISLIISIKMIFINENGEATSDGIWVFISSILGWFSNFFITLRDRALIM